MSGWRRRGDDDVGRPGMPLGVAGAKAAFLQEVDRFVSDIPAVHDECVGRGQDQKIRGPIEPGAFHADLSIVWPGDEP